MSSGRTDWNFTSNFRLETIREVFPSASNLKSGNILAIHYVIRVIDLHEIESKEIDGWARIRTFFEIQNTDPISSYAGAH